MKGPPMVSYKDLKIYSLYSETLKDVEKASDLIKLTLQQAVWIIDGLAGKVI